MKKKNLKNLMAVPVIKNVELASIRPDPENPRSIDDRALAGLRSSIEKFGYVDLLVVNKRDMRLVSWHQRFKILTEAGVKSCPVLFVDLDDANRKALAVTLNSQKIVGEWTAQIIPILESLKKEINDDFINLRLDELKKDIAKINFKKPDGLTDPDEGPEPPKKAQSKRGQIFTLGRHRVMCGDSTSADDVKTLMGGYR